MGKLLFFSDIHLEHDGSREKGLEEIVATATEEKVDKLVFGGDIVGESSIAVAETLGKNYGVDTAEAYHASASFHYSMFEDIVSRFEGEKHAIHGNHDPIGIHENIRSMDFKPNDEIGKVYLSPINTNGGGAELRYFNKGWGRLEVGENPDAMAHAKDKKPPIMLWHQGPHDQVYGKTEAGEEIKYECPDEFKKLGEGASINLYGHNHGSYVKYDAKSGRFDINMTTQDGYFAIVEYNDSHKAVACEVYRLPVIADNEPDIKKGGQFIYNSIASHIEQNKEQAYAAEEVSDEREAA